MDKSEPSYTVGGNMNWYSHYEEQYRASLKKLKMELPYDPMTEKEEELKILLMKVKDESEKPGLKLNIPKTKIMVSGPITSWQIDGEIVETVTDYFLNTADGDCSHEIKRHLLLGRKVITNLGSILIAETFIANKGLSSQSYGFSSSHIWM